MQDASYVARFWAKVDKHGPGGCWEWTAYRDRLGYGHFGSVHRRNRLAHRVSFELANGPFPINLWVLHRCDNPPCVNPEHLFLGTHVDNMRDMTEKGRRVSLPGERNANATITDAIVREIRRLASEGEARALTCTESGCDQQPCGRGLCKVHYARHKRAGALPATWARPVYAKEIAARLGISKKIVWDVLQGKSWSHVDPSPGLAEEV